MIRRKYILGYEIRGGDDFTPLVEFDNEEDCMEALHALDRGETVTRMRFCWDSKDVGEEEDEE